MLELNQVISTIEGGQRFGGVEVVIDALLTWGIDGQEGVLALFFQDSESGAKKELQIRFNKLKNNMAMVQVYDLVQTASPEKDRKAHFVRYVSRGKPPPQRSFTSQNFCYIIKLIFDKQI